MLKHLLSDGQSLTKPMWISVFILLIKQGPASGAVSGGCRGTRLWLNQVEKQSCRRHYTQQAPHSITHVQARTRDALAV